MNCTDVKHEAGCYKKADGSTESILIVNEYGYTADNKLLLVSTRYAKADGTLITPTSVESVSVGACCGDCQNFELDGCAAGTAYKLLISINGGIVSNKYINLTDGTVTSIEPANFVIGSCADVPGNTKMCFESGADVYTQLIVGGVTTYLKNGVEQTTTIDIAVAKAVVDNSTFANVVCCPECLPQVEATVQPTPTATGNTTNLNRVFKDSSGVTWFVDVAGNAISLGSPETVTFAASGLMKPSNPLAGDHLIVTDDGTDTGVITEIWLYSGNVWRSMPIGSITKTVRETFTATAGQTSFALAFAPNGEVLFARNGAVLNEAAFSAVGTAGTYAPSGNDGFALLAGDRIDVYYTYEDTSASLAGIKAMQSLAWTGVDLQATFTDGTSDVITTPIC